MNIIQEKEMKMKLPGEGDIQNITRILKRKECELCGEPAEYEETFLLRNYRFNPASRAYGRDDCSWSKDDSVFVCEQHKGQSPPAGMVWCSTFKASEKFAHEFLYWEEIESSINK